MNHQTEKELKAPDAFVLTSEKVFTWIEHNARWIGIVIGVVVVLSLGWIGYGFWESSRELKAAEAIYKAEAELKTVEAKISEERSKLAEGQDKKKAATPDQLRPTDYVKDFAPSVAKIKEQIKANGNTKAGLVSALKISYFLMQQKQYQEALAVLDLTTYKPSNKDVLGGFWLMHRGLTYLENQKTDEAIAAYETVTKASALKEFHPEALLKLGVAYEVKGDKTKAREYYQRLESEFPNTEASTSAQQYLRLLDLNQSHQG